MEGGEYKMMDDGYRVTLEAARVNVHMTQDESAKALGISKATLISWEHGDTSPTMERAQQLSELYKCPLQRINFSRQSSN
jgi:DNA-binding XRE family transcriptional regulator